MQKLVCGQASELLEVTLDHAGGDDVLDVLLAPRAFILSAMRMSSMRVRAGGSPRSRAISASGLPGVGEGSGR